MGDRDAGNERHQKGKRGVKFRAFVPIICACSATMPASLALAQTAPSLTREELRPDLSTPSQDALSSGLNVSDEIDRAPCPLAAPRYAAIRFQFNGATFANVSDEMAATLRPSFASYLGQELPISTVCEIRDRAATMLRDQGFLAAVQVPPQQIGAAGIVAFDVLMARIARIQIRGDAGQSESTLARYLRPLTEDPAFNQRDAERSMLLARRMPGFETRLTLRPGDASGEVIGDIRVERRAFVGEAQIQNFGSRSTGRFGGQIRAQFNDLTGLADRTSIALFASEDFSEQIVANISHDFAVGGNGLRLGGAFTYAWNDPTISGDSPFDTQTLIATVHASYPFVLNQGTQISGSFGFDFIDQDVRFGGAALNRDRLRVAFARVDAGFLDRDSVDGIDGYSASEPRWRLQFSAEVRQGLDLFGASDAGLPPLIPIPQSRASGNSAATILRLEGLAEFRPSPSVAFVLEPRVQLTGEALLSYEEFSGGNYTVGRGYDPGAAIGDRGVGFRSEIRVGSALPRTRESWAFQPYGFFDAAWVWNDDVTLTPALASDELFSAGAGLRVNWGDRARFDATVAVPLVRANLQTSTPDPRLLMSLLVRFVS